MKNLFYVILYSFCTSLLSAQVNQNRCGTFDVMKYRDEISPGYLDRVNATFDRAKLLAEQQKASRAQNDTIYRVQLVFHVVYTTSQENISDSFIISQVEVLNEDYRRRNADTFKTRGVFKNLAADAGIEFYLANVDPDGNATTGITHTQGNPGFLGFNPFTDNVKAQSTGGKDPWPTDRYVNIWVCNILGGLGVLGYAFPPDNAPNWPAQSGTDSTKQGIVLHFPVVGRNYPNPIDPTVTKGRSLVHEMGHYLGLRHIWGDGDCTQDDGIGDTPKADAAHQQTCDTLDNSCPDSPLDFPDMTENYMDYSDDRCQNMFTQEQVGIMRAMLQSSRQGVATPVVTTAVKEENSLAASVIVFPNPTTGNLFVRGLELTKGNVNYQVQNSLGQMIAKGEFHQGGSLEINLTNLSEGIYYLRVTQGQQTAVNRFVVQKNN